MWNWVCPKKRTVCFCSIFSCSDIRESGGPVDKGHFCSDVSIWKRPAAHMYARISDVSWLTHWGRRSKPSLSSHLIKHQKRELKMKKKFWMKHLEQPNSTETTSSTKGRKERKREEKMKKNSWLIGISSQSECPTWLILHPRSKTTSQLPKSTSCPSWERTEKKDRFGQGRIREKNESVLDH